MASTSKKNVDTKSISLDGNSLSLEDLVLVAKEDQKVELANQAKERMSHSRKTVEKILESRSVVYGITTGFGKFKDVFIKPEDSLTLQRNFLLSHAAGVGPPFDRTSVRAITLLRANALAKGFSGIRLSVVDLLLELLNQKIHPLIPEKGSVGASGDLAPLAHLALVLIGEGEAEVDGKIFPGAKALACRGLAPVDLLAKEGLALTNGTQVMTGVGALVVSEALKLAKTADIIGAMSLEALLGTDTAFKEEIHQARPHPGQLASAINLRTLLAESELIESHADCDMVQDAYSLRCMPQVHGASRQAFMHARQVIEIEMNSATDNPLIFDDLVYSAGNFHGQPLALVLDYVAIALSELANICERRIERLVNPFLSNGLPAFLTRNGGLNSGLMIAQYTAAALVSENKSLAHPASVDSIPTSANQEDHVSMGTIAGRKARDILGNLKSVLAIELLASLQGLDLRTGRNQTGKPQAYLKEGVESSGKQPGIGVRLAHQAARKKLPYLDQDRIIAKDIKAAQAIIESGELISVVEDQLGKLA
ncbi:MAG: histidine ammonia-lyase [Candidatus Obscuribacterales bacterium]|nr:histidine ammonia-lyase [Candidatus Obscuribacterales bacterium]